MTRKVSQIISSVLILFLLAGCTLVLPSGQETTAPKDVYISKVPLNPQKAPDQVSDAPTADTSPETTAPETTEATQPPETTLPSIDDPPEATTLPTEPNTSPPATEPITTPVVPPETQPVTTSPETQPVTEPPVETTVSTDQALENEAEVLPNSGAAVPNITTAVASGTLVKSNEEATIDYSNTEKGYVMVNYTATTNQRLKVQVKGPTTTYTYNLTPQQWAAFPLSDENGNYQITVYKNVSGNSYATVLSLSITVSLADEFAPFIRSNQYVNFDVAPNTVAQAAALAGGLSDPLQKVEAIYNYVVTGMTYDTQLAATVTSGYLPDLDSVLSKMSGICFDYAALMTGMLRSQGVPTKLVVGYAGDVYHAWINVWSENTGWVDGIIYFDGTNWQRMDPTFASSGGAGIMEYIGDGSNYTAKYFY